MTKVTWSGGARDRQIDLYFYDEAGNTTKRGTAAGGQHLTYDAEGNTSGTTGAGGATSEVYSADGDRLISRDADKSTLYLDDAEVSLTKATGAVTALRYYTFDGHVVAVRSGRRCSSWPPTTTARPACREQGPEGAKCKKHRCRIVQNKS